MKTSENMKATYTVSNATIERSDTKTDNDTNTATGTSKEASTFRTLLPQILASTAKNLLLIDLGLAVAFPTIVIPVLRGLQSDRNPNEMLHFSAQEASWYGSIAYISQPIGSAMSGWLSEPIGRKKAMILVNIPHIIAWTMLHFATTHEEVFIAAVLLGLGVGFMEAPIITYVGEICQPSIRGILIACAGVAAMLGFFIVYLLGTITTWRTVALCCLSLPLLTVVAISFIPETPLWLLSKNRNDEALKSLQWLRGWVSPKAVEKEFAEMQRYSENSNSCIGCQKANIKCTHAAANISDKMKELVRKRTMRPFSVVMFCFAISQFCGMTSIRPYMVQIFETYELPISSNWATVVVGLMGLLANIVCMSIIKVVGKRRLIFFSLIGTGASCFSLAFYAFNLFPAGWSTFDKHTESIVVGNENYFAMIMFFSMSFFTSVGVSPIPWILLGEVYPFKTRGIATGLTAALNYIMTFISVKTYINVEHFLSISGSMFMYGSICVMGLVVTFLYLPETENRTLEEIESFFSDNKKKLTNRTIDRSAVCEKDKPMSTKMADIHVMEEAVPAETIPPKNGCDNKGFN